MRTNIFPSFSIRKAVLLGVLPVFISLFAYAQSCSNEIIAAMKSGDARRLSSFFDKHIELTFPDKTYSSCKKDAEVTIQKFFAKVEPINFVNVKHGCSASNNTKFEIGNMTTSNGVYKVYMFFVKKGNSYVINELRFEK